MFFAPVGVLAFVGGACEKEGWFTNNLVGARLQRDARTSPML